MSRLHDLFATNLREACSRRISVSEVCREIGLNRQQFNRYIGGQSLPSAHNRLRIARFFGVEPADFDLPPAAFRARLAPDRARRSVTDDLLLSAYPGDIAQMRRYLGFYQTYHLSLSWPGRVVCSCTHLKERAGRVLATSLERIVDRQGGIDQRSRYLGLAAFRRNRLFIAERTPGEDTTFGHTILMPFEVHQRLYLRGITMGISWRKQDTPYASRMIFRYLGPETDRRALIARCGLKALEPGAMPEPVIRYLTEKGTDLLSV